MPSQRPADDTGRTTRRGLIKGLGSAAAASATGVVGVAMASHLRDIPDKVTISDDPSLIKPYRPRFVLEDVEPDPIAYYGLHAEHEDRDLAAVYGFVTYPFQDGRTEADSHLGDHEPIIVFYEQETGDIARVHYTPYHWFNTAAVPETIQFTSDGSPMFRVHPRYHHYQLYAGEASGRDLELRSLADAIDGWLANGMNSELALSQPYDPWDMFGRESFWRHTFGNYLEAWGSALWFNLGFAGAAGDDSDVSGVSAW